MFGTPELRSAPEPRTHLGFLCDALANEKHHGYKKNAPYKSTGVKELSPLGALPLFDLVWDVLPDMMHIVQGIWKAHVFQMFVGRRNPAKPADRKSWTEEANRDLQQAHQEAVTALRQWALSPEMQAELDRRSMHLGGEPNWIRNNIKICTNTSTLKAHDWMLIIQTAGRYILSGLFPEDPRKSEVLLRLLDATNKCLTATSAWDSENREEIDEVKLEVVEALCLAEAYLPRTEMPVMFHVLLHVPDAVYRWNAVRNYWSFFGERYVLVSQSCCSCLYHVFSVDIILFLST
jgi:hypothetical protein